LGFAWIGGLERWWNGRKPLARVVSLDRPAEDVWGGHPPEGRVTTVQIYVSHLRQALEPARARGAAGRGPGDQAEQIRYPRAQSVLQAVVIRGPASGLPVHHPVRTHGRPKPSGIGGHRRPGRPDMPLNTRLPPFTNIKARQAVNYAIDRARIIRLQDAAPGQATATCQVLPPDFPGHQGYCPYTAGAGDGAWHSSDMAKARRLVRESGTTNTPVTVWSFNDAPGTAAGSDLVGLLDDLGYRASLHAVSNDRFWADLYDPHLKIQVSIGAGWGADFPSPSTFFGPLLSTPCSCGRSRYRRRRRAAAAAPRVRAVRGFSAGSRLGGPRR
jgi:ABC-type transport system substrate-binding protein